MNKAIFREYDIRGLVDLDFSLTDAELIGRGAGTLIRNAGGKRALVGRDARLSSPGISVAVIRGLLAAGLDVLDAGLCPTPVLYWAMHMMDLDGGIMVTASHNPPEYNGFKICLGTETVFGKDLQNLLALIESGKFTSGSGNLFSADITDDYINYLCRNINIARPVRLAVDTGNGVGGPVMGRLLEKLNCPVRRLYFEPDGRFPNHPADPTVAANMAALSETVVGEDLELGIGLDGDADRIGVVDEGGRMIYGDMLTLIFARQILPEAPGGTVIGDVKCSHRLFADVEAHGGRAVMWKAGHSLMRRKRKDENAVLAGEMSGHIFFGHRYLGFDDGIYAALRMLEIVSRLDGPVSSILSDLPRTFSTPEIRVHCPEQDKFRLAALVRDDLRKYSEVNSLDGVRVDFADGWGLLRASNTGPELVLRFEAETESRLEEIRSLFTGTLERMKTAL